MRTIDMSTLPAFPVPDFKDVDVAFGAREGAYLTREELGDWYSMNLRTPYHEAVSGLFFKGGKLADYGLTIKKDLDAAKVMGAIRALLGSWAPKHEIKHCTVAVALANWCDYAEPKTKAA